MGTGVREREQGQGSTTAARLSTCRDRLDELEEQLRQERQRRNELIVAARDDDGMGYVAIARAAGTSKTQVLRVLAAN